MYCITSQTLNIISSFAVLEAWTLDNYNSVLSSNWYQTLSAAFKLNAFCHDYTDVENWSESYETIGVRNLLVRDQKGYGHKLILPGYFRTRDGFLLLRNEIPHISCQMRTENNLRILTHVRKCSNCDFNIWTYFKLTYCTERISIRTNLVTIPLNVSLLTCPFWSRSL